MAVQGHFAPGTRVRLKGEAVVTAHWPDGVIINIDSDHLDRVQVLWDNYMCWLEYPDALEIVKEDRNWGQQDLKLIQQHLKRIDYHLKEIDHELEKRNG